MAAKAPADLEAEGRALWRALERWRTGEHLRWDPHETVLVAELARTADRLASLRGALAGVAVTDTTWTRLAGEERQQRLAYGRLVSALGLPSGVPAATGGTGASRRGQAAARARWGPRAVPGAS